VVSAAGESCLASLFDRRYRPFPFSKNVWLITFFVRRKHADKLAQDQGTHRIGHLLARAFGALAWPRPSRIGETGIVYRIAYRAKIGVLSHASKRLKKNGRGERISTRMRAGPNAGKPPTPWFTRIRVPNLSSVPPQDPAQLDPSGPAFQEFLSGERFVWCCKLLYVQHGERTAVPRCPHLPPVVPSKPFSHVFRAAEIALAILLAPPVSSRRPPQSPYNGDPRSGYSTSVTQRNPTAPERSLLGAINRYFPCSLRL